MLASISAVLLALLVLAAWGVARRDPEHRGIAGYLAWMFASNHLRTFLRPLIGTSRPALGWHRLPLILDQVIVLSWSFLFLACCSPLFTRRRPTPALLGWLFASIVFSVTPWISRSTYTWMYTTTFVISTVAAWLCVAYGLVYRRELEPRLAHLVVMLFSVVDVVVLVIPFARGYVEHWPLVVLANCILYSVCLVAHGIALVRAGSETRTSSRSELL